MRYAIVLLGKKIKTMPQIQPMPHQFYRIRLALCALLLIGLLTVAGIAQADQFDEKIKALNQQNASTRGVLNGLTAEAQSYQGRINQLQSEINVLQGQIVANQAEQTKLQQQIIEAQNKIAEQKKFLGQNIKAMYIDGQLTTIEELATSRNLSEFVDKEEYRILAQNKIDITIKQIAELQAKLEKQKGELDLLIESQKQQNTKLASARNEQQGMLSYNRSQQNSYNSQIRANNSQIDFLRQQQIKANARFGGGRPGSGPACGGGYPAKWCEVPQDSVVDSWGMYNRECVSYTAFKVWQSGRHMPYWGGKGNANQWDDNARNAGIPVDGNPQVGDVAQTDRGPYGHVMYVEHVYGDGTILISQYNASLDGRYSTARISAGGLDFIHF